MRDSHKRDRLTNLLNSWVDDYRSTRMKPQKEEQEVDDEPVKRGLVLQGGGAKGAYAYGC